MTTLCQLCSVPRLTFRREEGGGGLGPNSLCIKNGPIRFFQQQISLFPKMVTLVASVSLSVPSCQQSGLVRSSSGTLESPYPTIIFDGI